MLIYVFFFPPGYGLHCHRAIITMCRLIGIKDMYAKVTGSKNLINITRALFRGLTLQVGALPVPLSCGERRGWVLL